MVVAVVGGVGWVGGWVGEGRRRVAGRQQQWFPPAGQAASLTPASVSYRLVTRRLTVVPGGSPTSAALCTALHHHTHTHQHPHTHASPRHAHSLMT